MKIICADRRWSVDVGLGKTLSLSGIPRFEETLAQIRSASSATPVRRSGRHLTKAQEERLRRLAGDAFGDGPATALAEIDELWASGSDRFALFDIGSLASLNLLLQTRDVVETGDALGGKTLALLAFAESARQQRLLDREALLAFRLGYVGDARSIASRLPAADPVRLFVGSDETGLKGMAQRPGAAPLTRYLHASLLASNLKLDELRTALGSVSAGAAPVLDLLMRGTRVLGGSLEYDGQLLRLSLRGVNVDDTHSPSGSLRDFERGLAALPPRKGPFLDTRLDTSRRRALFYSALHGLAGYGLDELSDAGTASEFVTSLGEADPGPGQEFRQWLVDKIAVKAGRMPLGRLAEALNAKTLGEALRRQTADELLTKLYATAPERPRISSALEKTLDSRPMNGRVFGQVCLATLHHPIAAYQYYDHYSEQAPEDWGLAAWLADSRDDQDSLLRLARNPAVSGESRLQAITALRDRGALAPSELRSLLLQVSAMKVSDGTTMGTVRALWNAGQLEDAERALREWISSNPNENPLRQALYASRLAHVLFLAGRPGDAWKAIEPWVSTWKGDALWAGAEALEGMGRHQEALQMAQAHVERYPDDPVARTALAQIHWRQGRFDAAADALLSKEHPLGPGDWGKFAAVRSFEVFEKRAATETLRALDALIRAGVNPWFLLEFASPFAMASRYEIAIPIIDAVAKSRHDTMDPHLLAYKYRVRGLGADAANAWFRETVVPSPTATWAGDAAFNERQHALLWLLPDTEPTWFLRVQDAILAPALMTSRRDALMSHYQRPSTPSEEALYARYLLGLEPREHLLDNAHDPLHRCHVAYLFGLAALGAGHLEEGADWLRIALRTGQSMLWSYKRSLVILEHWHDFTRTTPARTTVD